MGRRDLPSLTRKISPAGDPIGFKVFCHSLRTTPDATSQNQTTDTAKDLMRG
jgi:hypothetical protein